MATATTATYNRSDGTDVIYAGQTEGNTALKLLADTLTSGQSAELTTNNLNTLDGSNRYVNEGATNDPGQDWCLDVPYDPTLRIASGGGGPNGTTFAESLIINYDEDSNTWSNVYDPFSGEYLTHFYSNNAIDTDTHILYKMPRTNTGEIHSYNLQTQAVATNVFPLPPTSLGPDVGGSWNAVHGIAYMPALGTDGSLIHVNGNGTSGVINRFDINTGVWSNLADKNDLASLSSISAGRYVAHPNPTTGQVVVASGDAATPCWLVDTNGTVSDMSNLPQDIFTQANFLPHPSLGKSYLFANNGSYYVLDYSTGNWDAGTVAAGELATVISNANVYAFTVPASGVFVFQAYVSGGNSKVVIFKP